jgi:hypothetical protein
VRVDPQDLLPSDLRAKWAVIPRFELHQIFVAAFLLGAGAMAPLVGSTVGPTHLWYGFPLALIFCFIQARILGSFSDRLLRGIGENRASRDTFHEAVDAKPPLNEKPAE